MKKRILSLIMIIAMLISILPMSVSAADTYYFKSVINGNDFLKADLAAYYAKNEKIFIDNFSAYSLINNKSLDETRNDLTRFPESKMVLKQIAEIMYRFAGNQFQSFLNNRKDSIIKSAAYRCNDNQYEPKGRAFPVAAATELNLVRMPDWDTLENYNAGNKTINTLKDFVTLLGYRTIAEKRGGFPDGYISVAKEIGLTNGIEYNYETDITAYQFLSIANNALAVPLCLSKKEISSNQRDENRLLYTSDEDGEICNGYGPSGRYETLLTMHFNAFAAEGYLTYENGAYKYKINRVTDSKGNTANNNIGSEISVDIGDVDFNAVNGKPTKAVIQKNEYGGGTLLGIVLNEQYLATPTIYVEYPDLTVNGSTPTISWDPVPGADYYTIWDWTRWQYYHVNTVTYSFDQLPSFSEAGVYAISVYARNSQTGAQSEPGGINLTVHNTDVITMYAPDGRTVASHVNQAEAWRKVGWYDYPVTTVYAPDGRSMVIATWAVGEYTQVGWYTYPVMYVYNWQGYPCAIASSELNTYLNMGWRTWQ